MAKAGTTWLSIITFFTDFSIILEIGTHDQIVLVKGTGV
jgi:hypothetical protein